MSTKYIKVENDDDINKTVNFAQIIWREHFPKIIGEAATEYMLELFQSKKEIVKTINSGRIYYLIKPEKNSECIGYFAFDLPNVKLNKNSDLFLLSKIYILNEYRGKGHAKAAMTFMEKEALKSKANKIRLNVNEGNPAIAIYEKIGFEIFEKVEIDFGEGHIMKDYIMEKKLVGENNGGKLN